jgi:hypothetical protein
VHNVPLSLWSLATGGIVRTQHLVRRALVDVQNLKDDYKYTSMSPLVDYVLFNKNIEQLPAGKNWRQCREHTIISEVVERLPPSSDNRIESERSHRTG